MEGKSIGSEAHQKKMSSKGELMIWRTKMPGLAVSGFIQFLNKTRVLG